MRIIECTYGDYEVTTVLVYDKQEPKELVEGISIKDTTHGGMFEVQGYNENEVNEDILEDLLDLYCD